MLVAPVNELRRKNVEFRQTPKRQKAFDDIKAALAAQTLRVHFEESRPLILATDASPYVIGAVLMQKHDDSIEHMVTCASRTLSATKRRYAQFDKEALSIVFGFKRFRQYVVGREVLLYTYHKPLTFIFKPDAGVLHTALQRIQRWFVYLTNFSYERETSTRQVEQSSSRAVTLSTESKRGARRRIQRRTTRADENLAQLCYRRISCAPSDES